MSGFTGALINKEADLDDASPDALAVKPATPLPCPHGKEWSVTLQQ
jgi:hypothetical protein